MIHGDWIHADRIHGTGFKGRMHRTAFTKSDGVVAFRLEHQPVASAGIRSETVILASAITLLTENRSRQHRPSGNRSAGPQTMAGATERHNRNCIMTVHHERAPRQKPRQHNATANHFRPPQQHNTNTNTTTTWRRSATIGSSLMDTELRKETPAQEDSGQSGLRHYRVNDLIFIPWVT